MITYYLSRYLGFSLYIYLNNAFLRSLATFFKCKKLQKPPLLQPPSANSLHLPSLKSTKGEYSGIINLFL